MKNSSQADTDCPGLDRKIELTRSSRAHSLGRASSFIDRYKRGCKSAGNRVGRFTKYPLLHAQRLAAQAASAWVVPKTLEQANCGEAGGLA